MTPAVALVAKQLSARSRRRLRRRVNTIIGSSAAVAALPMVAIILALAGTPPSSAAFNADIPPVAIAAYTGAAARCNGLDWTVLAAIGKVESDHGRSNGAAIGPTGDVDPPIIGLALDGTKGTQRIQVPSGGSPWHDDPSWDHAAGPMQFITATWSAWGVDANEDDTASPHNLVDAAASAADYLCGATERIDDLPRAIRRYNNSSDYVTTVLAWAEQYQTTTTHVVAGDDTPLTTVDGIIVHTTLAEPVAQLLAAARADGIILNGWGWRSTATQIELRSRNDCPNTWTAPPSTCRIPTAIPGTSMHESGLAIDFTTPHGTITTRHDPAYHWLAHHAAAYGLHNLPSEPWHWSVNGR